MNKFAIKAAAFCLSAAMFSAAVMPSVTDVRNDGVVFAAAGDNLLQNSTCDTTKKFGLYLAGGAAAKLTAKDGALDVAITKVGTLNYGVQLNYAIIPLRKGGVYKLSYDIKTDCPRYTECMIQMDGGDYRSYVWTDCNVTEEWQTIEKEFEMEDDTDIAAKLCFNMGNESEAKNDKLKLHDYLTQDHHFYVDNVKVEIVDDSKVDYNEGKTEETPILTNQLGYLPDAAKVAVLRNEKLADTFSVVNAETKKEVFSGKISAAIDNKSAKETNYHADFSEVKEPGKYIIKWGDAESYPFSIGTDVYDAVLQESVYMLYTQRCGCAVDSPVVKHPECHTSKATIYGTSDKIDVNGGWHDAGDYGRYVVPAAKTIADLFIAYNTNKDLFKDNTGIPESGNGVADILDEARYELEWMLKMQDSKTGGVYHKVSCAEFPAFVSPEKETNELFVTPISSTATADFCASMAMAYENFKSIDEAFAKKCLAAAESAWKWLEANQSYVLVDPRQDITTGDYADFKKNDKDERYWAAAQMLSATGDSKYEEAVKSLAVKTGLGWAEMGTYGSFAYLSMDESKQNAELKATIKAAVLKEADAAVENTEAHPYGETLGGYFWGCNMDVANSGMLLTLAESLDSSKGYAAHAAEQLNYLLGKNPLGYSFVTGYGTVAAENPHHRPSSVAGKAVPGMLVGGPDSALEDTKAEAFLADAAPAKCWLDNADSYSTNEVTIYWNSPLTALIADVLSASKAPAAQPTDTPTEKPSDKPTDTPTETPSDKPTDTPTEKPSDKPTDTPTEKPSDKPTDTPTETPSDKPADKKLGDVNGDGKIDITDVSVLSIHLIGDKKIDEEALRRSDVDADNEVGMTDLATLKQFVSKVIDKLGV